jgi:hypothetical protein
MGSARKTGGHTDAADEHEIRDRRRAEVPTF